ncbi:MAG: PIN domain-containing protein [Isosphaeraceae bacterium]
MNKDRFLIDTLFVQALLNKRDQFHEKAVAFFPRMRQALEVFVTEIVLIEIADSLCSLNRQGAAHWIDSAYHTQNIKIVKLGDTLYQEAFALYKSRSDKTWSLTDCISCKVMWERGLTEALTADRHFIQAGFRALLLDENIENNENDEV